MAGYFLGVLRGIGGVGTLRFTWPSRDEPSLAPQAEKPPSRSCSRESRHWDFFKGGNLVEGETCRFISSEQMWGHVEKQ